MSAEQASERVILSPQQAVDRILVRLAYRIAAAEAKFMEEAKEAEWPRFFRLLVDHCLDCFDAAAIVYSPLANGGKRFKINRLYTELLHRERERTISRLERLASCFPEEIRRELQSQLSHGLEVQIRFWWARVGEALSDLDSGPFLIGDPSASKEKPPSPVPELQAADIEASSSPSDRRSAVDSYIAEVLRVKGRRISRTDIWKRAAYKTRTEFERWQRNDPKNPNKAAHEVFTRILAEKPHCN